MTKQEQRIVDLYLVSKLSEQQIAEKLRFGSERIRWVLKKHKVQKRSISEALRYLHITKFKKKEFVLNKTLTTEQEKLKIAGIMLYGGEHFDGEVKGKKPSTLTIKDLKRYLKVWDMMIGGSQGTKITDVPMATSDVFAT